MTLRRSHQRGVDSGRPKRDDERSNNCKIFECAGHALLEIFHDVVMSQSPANYEKVNFWGVSYQMANVSQGCELRAYLISCPTDALRTLSAMAAVRFRGPQMRPTEQGTETALPSFVPGLKRHSLTKAAASGPQVAADVAPTWIFTGIPRWLISKKLWPLPDGLSHLIAGPRRWLPSPKRQRLADNSPSEMLDVRRRTAD
jgi:hypothetical protein